MNMSKVYKATSRNRKWLQTRIAELVYMSSERHNAEKKITELDLKLVNVL